MTGSVFETERLIVRPWRDDEAPRLFDIRRRPEITRWFGTPTPMASVDEAHERIARWRAITEADPRLGSWAICERAGGPPAGSVILMIADERPDRIEVGWDLHPDATGRGLATEAARGAIAKAFADGAPEVFAVTVPDNHRSRRVAVRAGMHDLGVVGDEQLFRARAAARPRRRGRRARRRADPRPSRSTARCGPAPSRRCATSSA